MSSKLQEQATRAILSYAVFRLESALITALTIVLVFLFPHPFGWWQWWMWLALGIVAEALIIYTSVTDPETGRQVVAEMLHQQFNPRSLQSPRIRGRMDRALEYREQIEQTIRQRGDGALKAHLRETTARVDDWLAHIFNLAQRLDRYEQDPIVARDKDDFPQEVARIRQRLQREGDPSVREQMQEVIRQREAQQANLERLENTMERAEFRMEETLAALGTLYSQLLLLHAGAVDSGRAQRLRQDIADQVAALQDTIEAMDEVYERQDYP
jgi:chromosome segregation ATPase